MVKGIGYTELSNEIKKEFNNYLIKNKYSINDIDCDEILSKWFEEEFEIWYLKNYENNSKRKNIRIDIDIPVTVIDTLVDNQADQEIESMIFGEMLNLSRGGLYCTSKAPIKKGSIIKVKIDVSKTDPDINEIEALAMVVRVDDLEKDIFGIGLMFSSVYENEKNELDTFIFKRIVDKMNEPQ